MLSARAAADADDVEDEDDNDAGAEAPGFTEFARGKTVHGILLKLNPVPSPEMQRVRTYVNEGTMVLDHQYVRILYGLVNPSYRRDYGAFWESPWAEEHASDASGKRKWGEQQRALAFRNYVRASCTQDVEDAAKYIESITKVMDWAGQKDAREAVRTVSRMVLGFEAVVIRRILTHRFLEGDAKCDQALRHLVRLRGDTAVVKNGVHFIANTLRRSPHCFDAFAALVAQEITEAESHNGSKNTSIHISKCITQKCENRLDSFIWLLDEAKESELPVDTVGLPLLHMRHNLCLRNDVLVVGAGDEAATYILSLDGPASLTGVDTIKITGIYTEDEDIARTARSEKRRRVAAPPEAADPAIADLAD